LSELLGEGEDLCRAHFDALPIMALNWLLNNGCAELHKLAMEAKSPSVHMKRSEVQELPRGTVSFPIETGNYHLGTIIVKITNHDRADVVDAEVEILDSERKYVKHPIIGMKRRQLVLLLTRAMAALRGQ